MDDEDILQTNVIDGRSLRRTGRTEQFSTKVHPKFKSDLANVAKATGKNYNVILEECLEIYVANLDIDSNETM